MKISGFFIGFRLRTSVLESFHQLSNPSYALLPHEFGIGDFEICRKVIYLLVYNSSRISIAIK